MKILAIQNRMGIGDTVIYLPYIKAISENFNTPVSILVKECVCDNNNNVKIIIIIMMLLWCVRGGERRQCILLSSSSQ